MMGTDRFEIFRGPCRCGKGHFVVDECSPDHGWPSSRRRWYRADIECDDCKRRYQLQQKAQSFHVIDRDTGALDERPIYSWSP